MPSTPQIIIRSKEAVELFDVPDTSSASEQSSSSNKGGTVLYKGKSSFHISSPDGTCAFIHDPAVGLIKRNLDGRSKDGAFLAGDSKAVQLAKCSPRGSCLLTWERPKDGNNNLKVWSADNGSLIKGFSCKKATLNKLQWSHDEKIVMHLVTNEVHVYNSAFVRVGKVRCQSITSFSLPSVKGFPSNTITSKQGGYLLTTFVPGMKGKPARVDLLRYPDRMGRESSTVPTDGDDKVNETSGPALTSKTLFNAEEVTVNWSPRADSALLLAQTTVDATGESYYGSTHLFLLLERDAKIPTQGSVISVPFPAAATKTAQGTVPIVGCNWIPNPTVNGVVPFGLISGSMPALASLHHGVTGDPTFLFGRAHRNTMDVSPHGRFIVCGGYGNLAGGMDFWDRNKSKMIPRHVMIPPASGSGEASYVTVKEASDLTVTSSSPVVGHQWAPDSRTYAVSTTSPRMNVDNGVSLFRYDGSQVDESKLPWDNNQYKPNKLLSAEFVPAPFPADDRAFYCYEDRPQSPAPRRLAELKGKAAKDALTKLQFTTSASNGKGSAPAKAYVPPGARKGGGGAYVPPGARAGRGGGGGGSSLADRMRQEREGGAAAVSGVKVTAGRKGPVGAASVNSASVAGADGQKSKSAARREKQRMVKEQAERDAAEAEEEKKAEVRALVESNRADPAKRAKKINKTLKQIDEIKAKQVNGVELNDDQKAKMASEESLRKELDSLNL